MRSSIFHLAIPCANLSDAEKFYGQGLGCRIVRKYDDRITVDFFGDQVVCHLSKKYDQDPDLYPRHFGHTFVDRENFDKVLGSAKEKNLPFFKEPFVRFAGKREEHHSFVIRDPSNNLIEFKYYLDPQMIY